MGFIAVLLSQAAVAQLAITVQAPQRVSACEAVEVVVTTSAPTHVAPLLSAPSFAPFQLVRRTAHPAVTLSRDGEPAIRVVHRFVLTTVAAGTFVIPPFVVQSGGTVAQSRPLRIAVQASPGAGVPSVVANARLEPGRDITFKALATPDTVYVGQQVQYEVAVFLNERIRERLRRSPTFFPPEMPAMLAYDLPASRKDPPRRQAGGQCFEALVYQRALFPLQSGRTVIPPAQLAYSLPLGPGMFSREETHELRTDSVVVVAVDPPVAGRPANDIGAVGRLAVHARVDTTQGRVGDPVTLTVRVAGEGNVKLLPRPHLALAWGSVIPDAERVAVDSAAPRVSGAKEFDWLILPRLGGRVLVPPVEYPHFDPYAETYVVARTQPITLEVEAAPLAKLDTPVVARLGLRARYRGPLGAPLHAHPAVWILAAAAPLPAIIGSIRRRRRTPVRGATAAETLLALSGGPADPRQVRRAFVAALAERLRIPAGVFTRSGAVERALRRSGVTRDLAGEAERFLRELDAVAYGSGLHGPFDAAAAASGACALFARIDAEALARWELGPSTALGMAMAFATTFAAAAIASPARDAADFANAAAHYHAGELEAAARGFEALALREPRAPDAWANYGTASWELADTAAAVVGWQRALRLEPAADDMRRRLETVRIERVGAPGHVPPVGVTPLALSALVLWLFTCALAVRAPPRGSALRAVGIASTAASLLLAGFAVVTDERLVADDRVVLRRGGALAASPALGARRDARVETGEIGRAGAREGGWTHVRFDGARAGWVPSSELVSIARAPVRGD